MIISRRKTLIGWFAAPAIIAYDRLMPVKAEALYFKTQRFGDIRYKGRLIADVGLFYCPYMPIMIHGNGTTWVNTETGHWGIIRPSLTERLLSTPSSSHQGAVLQSTS